MKNINLIICHPDLLVLQALEHIVRQRFNDSYLQATANISSVMQWLNNENVLPLLSPLSKNTEWFVLIDSGSFLTLGMPESQTQGLDLLHLNDPKLAGGCLGTQGKLSWLRKMDYNQSTASFLSLLEANIAQYLHNINCADVLSPITGECLIYNQHLYPAQSLEDHAIEDRDELQYQPLKS